MNPQDSSNLWLGATNGLYRSVDAGATWIQVEPDRFSWISDIVIAPTNPLRIFLRSYDSYRSDDGGVTWTKFNFPQYTCNFAVAPSDENRIYAYVCGQDTSISITDSRTIYAQTDDALYRSVVTETVASFGVFLPLTKAGDTVVATDVAQLATNRFNDYRALAGVALLRTHPALVQAAQSHADYRRINKDDSPILVIDKRMYQHRGEVANIPIHFLPVQKHLWVIHSRSRGLMECSRWISQKCATVQIV